MAIKTSKIVTGMEENMSKMYLFVLKPLTT